MASKIKGLQVWCQKMTEGYPNVNVSNFTTAWRDGLAFCAIIHRFRPDLIDFDSLSSENVFENCKMAFEIAEKELSIPAFLEAEDMVRLKTPDKLSIITYVSQYYNFLHSLPQLGGPGIKGKVTTKTVSGTKRPTNSDSLQAPVIKKASTSETKENSAPTKEKSAGGDKCGICQNHVYLMERHIEGGKLYHRSCFRHSDLSPANKVYTRSPFLSNTLSSETKTSTSLSTDKKSNVPPGIGNSSKGVNVNSEINVESAKVAPVTFTSKKSDGAGFKHPIDEPGRENSKKSRMQPRTLFGDEKSNKTFAVNDTRGNLKTEHPNIKNNQPDKSLPLSSKEAHNLERRQDAILTIEKALGGLPKNTRMNMPLIFQQKDKPSTDTTKNISSAPSPVAVRVGGPVDIRITSSKTSSTALSSQPNSEIDQSKLKLLGSKDNQKPSEVKKLDTVLSKTNVLPSVQNLQKMFSSKPNDDSSEPVKPAHPIARPRSGTFKAVGEDFGKDSVTMKSTIPASAKEKSTDITPKAAPRKSMLEVSETIYTPKQPETFPQSKKSTLSTDSSGDHVVTSNVMPLFKKSDGQVPSGLLTSLAEIRGQISSSPGPANHTSQLAAKIPASTPSSNMKVKSDINIISSTKTSMDKTYGATRTPLSLHSVSQTDTLSVSKDTSNSTKSVVNTPGLQLKSHADKLVVSQGHKDSTASMNTSNLQTPNKIHGTLSTLNSVKPEGGKAGVTPTNQSFSTDIKLARPEKVSNESSDVVAHSKDAKTPRASINPMNHNSDAKPTNNNPHNLKYSEIKSENEHSKNISKQNVSKLAPANQIINIDKSKIPTSSKNFVSSSNKEDSLDINTIRLKSVMPERKEVQKESRAALYDIKLKKVDVIKGDTKWDSSAQKPLNVSETGEHKRNAGKDKFENGDKNGNKEMIHLPSALSSRESQSPVTTLQNTNFTRELPQWKKGVEERRSRDNITESKSDIGHLNHFKGNDGKKTAINSENNLGLAEKQKAAEIQAAGERAVSHLKKPAETVSLEKNSMKNNSGPRKNGRKLSPTRESQGNISKLDWQLEAEKRMAAIAGFDMEVVGQLKGTEKPNKVSSEIPATHQPKKNHVPPKSEGDFSKVSVIENSHLRKYSVDTMMGGDSIAQNRGAAGTVIEKGASKLKDLELQFVLNKTKLKPVEVDICISPGEEIENPYSDRTNIMNSNNGKSEDFRHMLHQLKHVPIAEYGKMDLVKTDNGNVLLRDTCDKPPSAVTKSLLSSSMNNNNNNNQHVVSEHDHIPNEHFQNLNKNQHTPGKTFGFQGSTDENGKILKNNSEPSEEKVSRTIEKNEEIMTVSPKVLRKVAVQDNNNKVAAISPPSSPKLKKIQVTKKFDFEKSSDFEQSLTESTAKLNIQDKQTPPMRPPPPRPTNDMLSPNHISVIELQTQLLNIDSRLTELEQRGRQLEESIRKVTSREDDEDDDEELMIEWFSLINEKNDLVRKEADLVYLSREQELESEQEQIESQLRYLLSKPDECKSPEEKQEEDYLIKHKVELVEQRNMIVDSMDDDRIRYKAEDEGIEVVLKHKGYWKDSTGTLKALKGKKVAKSVFYA